jgi:hypothetical protein
MLRDDDYGLAREICHEVPHPPLAAKDLDRVKVARFAAGRE